jgi:apolipoprotein N-acyltransferase
MKQSNKEFLKNYFVAILIALIVHFSWVGMEILEFGEPTPSVADSIIYALLCLSLCVNYGVYVGIRRFNKKK